MSHHSISADVLVRRGGVVVVVWMWMWIWVWYGKGFEWSRRWDDGACSSSSPSLWFDNIDTSAQQHCHEHPRRHSTTFLLVLVVVAPSNPVLSSANLASCWPERCQARQPHHPVLRSVVWLPDHHHPPPSSTSNKSIWRLCHNITVHTRDDRSGRTRQTLHCGWLSLPHLAAPSNEQSEINHAHHHSHAHLTTTASFSFSPHTPPRQHDRLTSHTLLFLDSFGCPLKLR